MSYIGSKRSSSLVSFDEGTIGSGVVFPAGHVIQIQSSTLTAPETTSSTTSFETIDGTDQNGGGTEWCVKITPLLSSSKIYVNVNCGVVGGSSNVQRVFFGLFRDSAQIALGDAGTGVEIFMAWTPRAGDGYQMTNMSNSFLDSPTIPSTPVEIKYGLQWYAPNHTGTINRPSTVDANGGNAISTISVFEVAG
jgi:hypothetical protein